MWLWLKDLLKVAVGTIIFGLVLYVIGVSAVGSMFMAFVFGFLVWFGWELHRWEKKHGWD